MEKARSSRPLYGEVSADAAESENLRVRGHPKRENREILLVSTGRRVASPLRGLVDTNLATTFYFLSLVAAWTMVMVRAWRAGS